MLKVFTRKAIKYVLICTLSLTLLAMAGVIFIGIGVIPYCTNTILQAARSPDDKWLALVEERICNATFVGPFKIVTIQDASKHSGDTRVVEFEMGSVDDRLSINWSSDNGLEITVSDAIDHFGTKANSYGPIAIKYNTVPARSFSLPPGQR